MDLACFGSIRQIFFVLLEYILKSFSFRREVTPAVFHNKNTFNLAVTELNKESFTKLFLLCINILAP